ncbi:MAG: magnesium transporter, partial [Bacteroidota bacterium]|nr:magnesium transporter [Bacteroidota bacterium]
KSNIKDDQNLIHLIEYHEDSAGGLMAKELLKIPYEETVSQCISVIQKNTEEVENIYAVYVVDENEKLKGIIPLQTLVLSQPNKSVKEIFKKEVISVKLDTPAEDVANKMQRYDLVVLPVVDENNVLVGRITIDDVLDFVKEEAEEDYQLMSGITEDVDIKDKVWVLSRSRLPWLILGLIGGIFASLVIGNYEDQIKIAPEMAFFIPLITAMAGNAGIQSSAIVVQALASNTFEQGGFLSKISKEISVAMINGLVCAALLLTYGFIFEDSLNIAYTISLSLFAVIIIASALGITIPFILDKLKIDPALATGPFITTSNDLIGLAVYFWLGHLMYSVTF